MQKFHRISGLILAFVLVFMFAPGAYAQYTPAVLVADQDVVDGHVTVNRAVLNDAGWIVGYSENIGRLDRAVLWRRNEAPVARIDGPTTGMKKKPLMFSAAGSTDPDGDALSFSWSFGDGTAAAAGSSATHEYADWGSYTATLTARDAFGLSSSVTSEVTVAPPGHLKHR